MVPGGKDVAGVAVLLEKVKACHYAEHEDADGSLRQLAVTRKDSHKGQVANGQRPSSIFRLTLLFLRGVIGWSVAREM